MIAQVVTFPDPDLTTPDGQLRFIQNKLYRLTAENDPRWNTEALGPAMPMDEQLALIAEMLKQSHNLEAWIGSKMRRERMIAGQLAAGGLPWLAIQHIMLERGFTHVRMQHTTPELATWYPYNAEIAEYYYGLLLPDRGPGWFMDCAPDFEPKSGLWLSIFECIKLESTNE